MALKLPRIELISREASYTAQRSARRINFQKIRTKRTEILLVKSFVEIYKRILLKQNCSSINVGDSA